MISEIFRNFRDGCCLVINVLCAKFSVKNHANCPQNHGFRDSLLNIAQRICSVNNFFQKILRNFPLFYRPFRAITIYCIQLFYDHNFSYFLFIFLIIFLKKLIDFFAQKDRMFCFHLFEPEEKKCWCRTIQVRHLIIFSFGHKKR